MPNSLSRRHQRLDVSVRCSIEHNGRRILGQTRNMSAGGVLLYSEEHIASGSLVDITFFSKRSHLKTSGRVLRSYLDNAYYTIAVEFITSSPEESFVIEGFALANETVAANPR